MSTASKFTFDVEFRPDGDVLSNAARTRIKKTLTQDEIDLLCAKAREQGVKAGQVRALEGVAVSAREAAEAIRDVLDEATRELDSVRAECAELAMMAARKLARAALAAAPTSEVESALRDAMHQAIGEPRILVRVAPQVADAISQQLPAIAHEEGFEGRVQLAADPNIRDADCRIEWRGGGAERVEAVIEAALAELVTRRFSASAKPMTEDDDHVR